MHEAEWYKFREAAGLALNVAEKQQLVDPVSRGFHVSVHERGGRSDSTAVRGANDLIPLFGGQLITREDVTNLIVKNLRRSSGQGVETIVTKHRKIIGERHAGELNAVHNFHGRKGMDMHAGNGFFHGTQDVAIVEGRQAVRKPSLNADLSRSEIPCFLCLSGHLLQGDKIGVGFAGASAEGAELTPHETHVGEIDIAV